jgi:hypothetical protein
MRRREFITLLGGAIIAPVHSDLEIESEQPDARMLVHRQDLRRQLKLVDTRTERE